uniref:Uncharacterized protein n=1 Tax=Arundo donax TaxID=35708 RepID=A0A0A9BZ58_ARUDO
MCRKARFSSLLGELHSMSV